jgi:hypothetical protein
MSCDVMITGTGSLAEACLFAFADCDAGRELQLAIAGRNPQRLDWLALAANCRSVSFGKRNFTRPTLLDWDSPDALARELERARPKVIIQTASMQTPWSLGGKNKWARMIAAGGYGLATPLHTALTVRLIVAARRSGLASVIVNGAFPDLANSIVAAMDLPVPMGFGNIDIVASCVTALDGRRSQEGVQLLGQYEPHCAAFRLPAESRAGMSPRVWLDGVEMAEAEYRKRTAGVRFPGAGDDGLNQLTGTTVIPLALALLDGRRYVGHACGPFGLPGGYPVTIEAGRLALRLPPVVTRAEAVAYNKGFEHEGGIVLDAAAKRIRLEGSALKALEPHAPGLANGYSVATPDELEAAGRDLLALRARLEPQPAA